MGKWRDEVEVEERLCDLLVIKERMGGRKVEWECGEMWNKCSKNSQGVWMG